MSKPALSVTITGQSLPATGKVTRADFNKLAQPASATLPAPTLDALEGVVLTGVAAGHVLKHNGTNWVNGSPAMAGASSGAAGAAGFAPQPSAGDQAKFLRGDATWAPMDEATGARAAGTLSYTANASTDYITLGGNADSSWVTGTPCTMTLVSGSFLPMSGTFPSQVQITSAYLIRYTATSFKLATSRANALAGTAINITDPGEGTFSLSVAAAAGVSGLLPGATVAQRALFLRGDGSYSRESDVVGASASVAGVSGLVPAPAAGSGNKFLAGDGTFKAVPGTVKSAYWTGNSAEIDVTTPAYGQDLFTISKPAWWADGAIYACIFRATTMPTFVTAGLMDYTAVYYAIHYSGGEFILFDTYAKAALNNGQQLIIDTAGGGSAVKMSTLPLLATQGVRAVTRVPAASSSAAFTTGRYRVTFENAFNDENYARIANMKELASGNNGFAGTDYNYTEAAGYTDVATRNSSSTLTNAVKASVLCVA